MLKLNEDFIKNDEDSDKVDIDYLKELHDLK